MGDAARVARTARTVPRLTLASALLLAGAAAAEVPRCPAPEAWQHETLDTPFERERRLAGLALPLRSHGRVRRDGDALWWHTEVPVQIVMRIDRDGVFRSAGDGAMVPVFASADGAGEIASLVATLVSGDLAAAAADFTIERQQDPASGAWRISLMPRGRRLATLIRRVELSGCDRLATVVIEQPNGDLDRVVFGEGE